MVLLALFVVQLQQWLASALDLLRCSTDRQKRQLTDKSAAGPYYKQPTLPPTEPVVMQDLRYFVDAPSKAKSDNSSKAKPDKLELLKGITGYAAPGVLTALMGGSGMLLSLNPGAVIVFLDSKCGPVSGLIGFAVHAS